VAPEVELAGELGDPDCIEIGIVEARVEEGSPVADSLLQFRPRADGAVEAEMDPGARRG
jgi:hypothetical protein